MDSKEKIIAAAIEVYAEKGRHGARMEEIAEKAGINKAMVYYFFTTRENLYREVLATIFIRTNQLITEKIRTGFQKARDFRGKIEIVVRSHFDVYSENPRYNNIMLEAISTCPEELKRTVELVRMDNRLPDSHGVENLFAFFDDGIAQGVFRKINPRQVLISILGMNLIYFISKPISQLMLESSVKDEKKFIKERQDSIVDLLLYGIMNNRSAQ